MSGNILDSILEEIKEINKKQSSILERLEVVEKYLGVSDFTGETGKALPNILTVKELAEFMNINLNRAYQLTHRADFPSLRLGRKIMISRNKLLEWIDKRSEEWVD